MHHPGKVISRTELTEHLYDQDFDRDSNTIEVFVGRLRKKLGVDLIETVRGMGYRIGPDRSMRISSLSLRVALIAAGGSALALVVAGGVFIVQFTNAVERNFDARLETLLLTLITATNDNGEVDESDGRRAERRQLFAPALRLVLADPRRRGPGAPSTGRNRCLRHPAGRGHADRGRSLAHPSPFEASGGRAAARARAARDARRRATPLRCSSPATPIRWSTTSAASATR